MIIKDIQIDYIVVGMVQTNCYIIHRENSDQCVIADPGDRADTILKYLDEKGLTPEAILLTHGHFDHALGVKTLRDATGATVWVGAADESLLYLPERNCADLFFPKDFDYPSVHADRLIKTGDEIRLGANTFRVTETPGHTEGSVIFDTGEYLFTGDTLFANGFGRTDLYGGNMTALLTSLRKIQALSGERKVRTGHGNSSTLSKERKNIEDILYNYS